MPTGIVVRLEIDRFELRSPTLDLTVLPIFSVGFDGSSVGRFDGRGAIPLGRTEIFLSGTRSL